MKKDQKGQTLIETMAAVFVLVMGITAVVAMASFSLGSSSNVTKQLIGVGLAREGIEAVKNMRDTNWLQDSTVDTDCFNFNNNQATGSCHRDWLDNTDAYTIAPSGSSSYNYVLSANLDGGGVKLGTSNDIKLWQLSSLSGPNGFALASNPLQADPTKLFYYPATATSDSSKLSGYYRQITITKLNTTPPYDQDGVGPAIRIISKVWWTDKHCPVPNPLVYPTTGSCRVSLETVLTNWKTN